MNITFNEKKCSGCGICKLACSIHNFNQVTPSKALLRIEGLFPEPGYYQINFCDQCGLCAEACPEEVIELKDGIFRINEEECTACHICVDTCPHDVIIIKAENNKPAKCIHCGECALVCPRQAIMNMSKENIEEY